ncbi:cytochrome b5-related protein [Frankliniella occidentalis]|uniref:Cytochrome b5-related protein n=1 Tax=Frankliniella occidentalis TaxID=133901 RepID=A0A9C6X104_FRAOC|nr:cytochrome b5-related protein [Frankliniella occidentalis]
MAPREAQDNGEARASTLPGLWKYPSHRESDGAVTGPSYLDSRRRDDGAEGLWRVHDKLYDLEPFVQRHPGGEHWLRSTKGMDITELFESHHVTGRAPEVLARHWVRDATQPRNSPYTFLEDGFYRTLKRRAAPVLAATPDPGVAPRFNDALVAASLACAGLGAAVPGAAGWLIVALAGVLVSWSAVCAHNFTHRRDNWRMYYKSLCFMSLSDWRVSHILSHHMYPNTLLDIEISMHEPLLQFLPTPGKPLIYKIASFFVFTFYAATALLLGVRHRVTRLRLEDFLPLLYLGAMLACGAPALRALAMWLFLCVVHSLVFHFIGLTAAHHHPDIFHDGDAPREDRDWGLGQLDAVRDRADHGTSHFRVLTSYGDHALHHLFPTVDHCRLPALYPVLYQTLEEFGVEYRFSNTWELFVGAFKQLARTEPNPRAPAKLIALGRHLRSE